MVALAKRLTLALALAEMGPKEAPIQPQPHSTVIVLHDPKHDPEPLSLILAQGHIFAAIFFLVLLLN